MTETAELCDRADNGMDLIAGCIREYVCRELEKIGSKRKRDMKALDFKLNMVSFYVPTRDLVCSADWGNSISAGERPDKTDGCRLE